MDQEGVEIRPIRQLTGTSEFNEVFFDGARIHRQRGRRRGNGWKVAMGTPRAGASTLGQQLQFDNELRRHRAGPQGRPAGRAGPAPAADRRLDGAAHHALEHAAGALRSHRGGAAARGDDLEAFWGRHRDLGNLAMDVLGPYADLAEPEPGYELTPLQRLFLFTGRTRSTAARTRSSAT